MRRGAISLAAMANNLTPQTALSFLQDNPKCKGSKAHERYEKYKGAKNLAEVLNLGGSKADVMNDVKKGFCSVAGAEPPPPVGLASPARARKRNAETDADNDRAAKRLVPEPVCSEPMQAANPAAALAAVPPAEPAETIGKLVLTSPTVLPDEAPAGPSAPIASNSLQASVAPKSALSNEVDLSFAKLEGKPIKFIKRAMGEAKRLLSEKGLAEGRREGLDFSLIDRDNLSKYAVTVRDLNVDGKLHKDLEKHGLESAIDLEISIPDGFPLEPPFVRVLYPQLSGGFVFHRGGICFEPLTQKGWAPSMTLASLCIAVKGIMDMGDVRVSGVGNKATRSVPQYTEEGARKDAKAISDAHRGGDSRTYGRAGNS